MYNFILIITLALIPVTTLADSADNQITEESYLSNVGNCPCPYNTDKAGNLCGKRSAWCRSGGDTPECDVTKITNQLKEECNETVTTSPAPYNNQISEDEYLAHIGNCPCPYNIDKAGNLCGKRSAWCRPGGYSPACDLTKIPQEIIEDCKYNK